jgi:FKBP-type peptidyl-prolyl cis-trans isomerase
MVTSTLFLQYKRGDEIFVTQTMKGQPPPPSGNRLGQRQQERLQRLARRRKRQQRILSVVVAIILVVIASIGIWQYQRYTDSQAQIASQHEAATAGAENAHASATAQTQNVHATQTAQVLAATPTPVVGTPTPAPDKPPVVDTKPTTLPDGLQYIDLTEGGGAPAANGNTVSVIYTGWLQSSGQKFDSSYDHDGQPFSVTLGQGQVIKGFEEGLVGIRSGGTRRLIIPPALAYGSQGASQGKVPIPPDATLIFDVTVTSIK